MKRPSNGEASECLSLRKKSRKGGTLTSAELEFCERMFTTYPEWYEETEAEVFNATLPFGANEGW